MYKISDTILVFGEVLYDRFYGENGSYSEVIGGAPANFAYRASRSLGLKVKLLSALGLDSLGAKAKLELEQKGFDLSLVQNLGNPTGLVSIRFNPDQPSEHSFTIHENAAYDQICSNSETIAAASHAPLIYFGTLAQRNEKSRATLNECLNAATSSCIKFCDINLRKNCYTNQTILSSVHQASIIKLNDEELPIVLKALDENFNSSYDIINLAELLWLKINAQSEIRKKILIVTLGANGAILIGENGTLLKHPGFKIDSLVDTVGCGDAFSAGFVASFIKGESLNTCLESGNYLGALVARGKGGMCEVSFDQKLDLNF